MTKYMTIDSPNAFLDLPVLEPSHCYLEKDKLVVCPVCHGHGKWHLELNAYGEGVHFDHGCNQCDGWGYVEKGGRDETCVHEFEELSYAECKERGIIHFGHCWHVWRCPKCGVVQGHDSSD